MSVGPHADPRSASAWKKILGTHRIAESTAVSAARARIPFTEEERRRIADNARERTARVRAATVKSLRAEAFLQRYNLSTREGIVLMCLAEALLRIPDEDTADALIRDKLAGGQWAMKDGVHPLVNAASWALMLTGHLARWQHAEDGAESVMRRLVARVGEPVVRKAIRHAVEILAQQFVSAENIEGALAHAQQYPQYRYSFDMLGEGARTAVDAERYLAAYQHALSVIAANAPAPSSIEKRLGLSIKLTALHPRFEMAQGERVKADLLPRLAALARDAAAKGVPLTIDAEEADRLLLTLNLFETLVRDPALAHWDGLGLAVQAYQKRALAVCDWLAALARDAGRRIAVRLVKGAYWDTEVKIAQVLGLSDYPVFTRKAATDVSYMACVHALLDASDRIYAQFATHNCHTVSYVLEAAGTRRDFEFQKLHGMGDALYDALLAQRELACRVYAPVGRYQELLPYLVRRLLENGANTSFVHQVADSSIPLESLSADPVELLPRRGMRNPRVPLPRALYPDRVNSRGVDLSDPQVMEWLERRVAADRKRSAAAPVLRGAPVTEPADRRRMAGYVDWATADDVQAAMVAADAAWRQWDDTPAAERAAILERAADAFESAVDEFISLLVREAGKTYADGVSEVREAVDFLRYYAARARAEFGAAAQLPGPVGEANRLELAGRGVFACISPWNFPLSIFVGQIAAALAAGNAVVAKPAEQTPLIAERAIAVLHEAGVPPAVLRLLCGTGQAIGAPLVRHPLLGGVAFTGSFETALAIQRELAVRTGPIAPLIAETGGLNAMVVDSSALTEQVIADVLGSAFNSAGQRCSALRILLLQEDAATRVLDMLAGAMADLRVGDPALFATDVGPVVDEEAKTALEQYIASIEGRCRLIARARLTEETRYGTYVAPVAFEIALGDLPQREVFGPVLHVVRYAARDLERVLDAVARTRYGLTLGIHSRIDEFVERVRRHVRVGNTYVNRNMIGAVVGVQPFGGEGLSGTGPKAGGPRYLHRFAVERTLTINTAAIGGSAELLAGSDGET